VAETFAFPEQMQLGQNLKFFYTDEDGDTITVTTQADLEEASKAMKDRVKLVVAPDVVKANEEMSQQMLNRSMSFMSSIPPRKSAFEEDFDKIDLDGALTERNVQPKSIDKKYTFNVEVEEQVNECDLTDCLKCNGTGLNKRGKFCKKCQGKGKVNSKFFKDLAVLLETEVKSYCENECKRLYVSALLKKREQQAKVVHNMRCSECNCEKITGVRYQCTQRPNFNICENCEENLGENSEYSFIKIRKPESAPMHLVCQYGDKMPEGYEFELRHAPVEQPKQQVPLVDKFANNDIDKSINFNFSQSPVVHPPTQNLGVSELSKSVNAKCVFVDKVDKIYSNQPAMKQNLLKMMEMGLTDFEACVAALEANNNNFELATSCFFM
jgi:hypothetical protein